MRLYPAIDLRGGRVVRLVQGDPARETEFSDDPLAQARRFAQAGFRTLHIIDLDAALGVENQANRAAIEAIVAATELSALSVQLGGGIRSAAVANEWRARGVARLIVSTLAVRDPPEFAALCAAHKERIWVSIDLRGEAVADSGWQEEAQIAVTALVRRAEAAGAGGLVRTEILKDGTAAGVDAPAVARFARRTRLPVIAAGGIASLADLAALKATGVVAGAVLGRALYDGALDARAAAALEAEWSSV